MGSDKKYLGYLTSTETSLSSGHVDHLGLKPTDSNFIQGKLRNFKVKEKCKGF